MKKHWRRAARDWRCRGEGLLLHTRPLPSPRKVSTAACNYGNASLTPDWAPDQAPSPFGVFSPCQLPANFLPFCRLLLEPEPDVQARYMTHTLTPPVVALASNRVVCLISVDKRRNRFQETAKRPRAHAVAARFGQLSMSNLLHDHLRRCGCSI